MDPQSLEHELMVSKGGVFDKPSAAHDEFSTQLIDAIECVRDGFAIYGADERLIFCNKQYRDFYPSIADLLKPGASLEELTRTAYEAGAIRDSAANIEARIEQRLMRYRTAEGTHEQLLEDGRWLLCSDRRTSAKCIVCIRTDISENKQASKISKKRLEKKNKRLKQEITERERAEEELNYQASHDALTDLINRREFERRAERLLSTARQEKVEHALCFMDLDRFKVINDTCGHVAGDELLRQLGRILRGAVRFSDTLARLGGDEFGALMEHCSIQQAHRVAEALHQAVQDYKFSWEGRTFRVGISIGLVVITEDVPDLKELLKHADAACYMAKDLGRNRIHEYNAEDTELAQRHGEMQWVERTNKALQENRFTLYAQAIVPLDGSSGQHYELLLRMIGEDGKIIPPGAFLPAAERYDLIEKLDIWVIEYAFSLLSTHPEFVEQTQFVSINLSGNSLTNKDFLNFIIEQLGMPGIVASKICFEITETAAISNLPAAISFITILRDLGCHFALDDFGSGLSSFGYLKNLPVDYLKIDGMFVKDMVDVPFDQAIVKSINDIAHVMGMQTIAEFVENDVIKGMLKGTGVDYAQGYGIEKPQPFEELLGLPTNVTDINKTNKG